RTDAPRRAARERGLSAGAARDPRDAYLEAEAHEAAEQAGLLRCLFGNPCRPISFDPTWRTPLVVSLAEAAYERRLLPSGELDPARLAVLAAALEEVGAHPRPPAHPRWTGAHG